MPSHPDRVRRFGALPDDYQFGDGRLLWLARNLSHAAQVGRFCDVLDRLREHGTLMTPSWRAPHENAAELLTRRGVTANVIEGEEH